MSGWTISSVGASPLGVLIVGSPFFASLTVGCPSGWATFSPSARSSTSCASLRSTTKRMVSDFFRFGTCCAISRSARPSFGEIAMSTLLPVSTPVSPFTRPLNVDFGSSATDCAPFPNDDSICSPLRPLNTARSNVIV